MCIVWSDGGCTRRPQCALFDDVVEPDEEPDEEPEAEQLINPNIMYRINQAHRPPLRLVELYNDDRTRMRLRPWLQQALDDRECVYCNRRFETLRGLEMHLGMTRRHMVWACCGRIFRNAADLLNHARIHRVEEEDEGEEDQYKGEDVGGGEYEEYDEESENATEYDGEDEEEEEESYDEDEERHREEDEEERAKLDLVSTVEEAESWGNEDSLPNWLQDRRCIYCNDTFSTVRGLQQHLKNVQRHEVYVCCNRVYKLRDGLERHQGRDH
ncbi:hypothetical protein HDV00_007562 [Rhizophlyctis rosea]|nr:hypothetical protein HDV00_007562 [Rhizophlyctis rosea]